MSIVLASQNKTANQAGAQRALKINGAIDLSFVHSDDETGIGRLYYCDPLKVLFPSGGVKTAALVTTGGGLFGGDTYNIQVSLEEKAQALVTGQAAEKVYRSSGPDCVIDVNLKVENEACLEWLPQETILFDQSRFKRTTKLDLSENSTALVGEIVVFGRLASGEEVRDGFLREAWEVRRAGKLIWSDALMIDGDFKRSLDHMSGFGGARAIATSVFVGSSSDQYLDIAREILGDHKGVRLGASVVNGVLICRWLAVEPYNLRKAFGAFWSEFRNKALGRPASLPRLWQC